MARISNNRGMTWLRYLWPQLTKNIPSILIQGLHSCPESALIGLDRFYASIIRSYIYVNKIFYDKNKYLALPENLWGQPKSPSININFCNIGLFTVVDLPLKNNDKTIDHVMVQNKFHQNKITFSSFLTCYHLQTVFGNTLSAITEGSHLVCKELVLGAKILLLNNTTEMLSLTKWETFFQKMPKSSIGKQLIFKHMLEFCIYTKFQEVNFKILSRILLTPKILAAVKSEPTLSACPWCKGLGTLEHILITCKIVFSTQNSLVLTNRNLMLPWKDHYWIFRTKRHSLNPIMWVTNFVIYKAFL